MGNLWRWAVGIVAVLHVYFMYQEMARWTTFAQEIAGLDPQAALATVPLGLNQGLYNGFLAAGLAWSLFARPRFNLELALFFLACVLVAGVVGGFTIKPPNYRILIGQAGFAALGLIAVWAAWKREPNAGG